MKPSSQKGWLERLEEWMFGEEDTLCDPTEEDSYQNNETCEEDNDEECDELDAILEARHCKDPCDVIASCA